MTRYKTNGFLLLISIISTMGEELTLSMNLKKPVSITNEKFLSITLDPPTLLYTGNVLSTNFEKSTNMMRALAPAYVRLAGPDSNSYNFERTPYDLEDDRNRNFIFSESHWISMQRWTENAGLDVIACIAPKFVRNNRKETNQGLGDIPEMISFSDHVGYNMSWQLGYECQTRCENSASDLGRRVLNLRKILDDLPRYSNSIIVGPDIVAYKTKQQQEYLQDYLNIAIPALSAITWHPNFAGVTLDNEGVSLHYDNLAADRDDLYKVIGRLAARRALWIAESKAEECKNQFLGALLWTRRLGNAAKLKIDVIMRQPMDLSKPTPDYWVSLLHKNLVGREVFDAKIQNNNNSHVYFYSQCTKPSTRYEKGSITIFGVNLTPQNVRVNVKGIKIMKLHEYILLPGYDAPNRMFAENILLNNEPLSLINDTYVPDIKPVILANASGLEINLPSGAIGFWVLPDMKVKSCMESHENINEKVSARKSEKRVSRIDVADDYDEEDREDETLGIVQSLDRSHSTKNEKKRQKSGHGNDKTNPKFTKRNVRRDLLKLKRYLTKKLETNEDKQPLSIRGSSRFFYDRHDVDSNENARNTDELLKSEEEIRSKLREYRNQLLRNRNIEVRGDAVINTETDIIDKDNDVLPKALALISQIENSLSHTNEQTSVQQDEGIVLAKVEDRMKSLYELLIRANLDEINDSTESHEATDMEERKISKRDLDKRVTEDPLTPKKESLLKKRLRTDDIRERRNERKFKRKDDIRRELQPNIFDSKFTESGENNFYGFFKREPAKDFPAGDIFLATGDSSQEDDYDYVKDDDDDDGRVKEKTKINPPTKASSPDYVDEIDNVWVEDENDRPNYVPNEFFENVKMPNFNVQEISVKDNAELWEVENHGHQNDDETNDSLEAEVKRKYISEKNGDVSVSEKDLRKFSDYYGDAKASLLNNNENYEDGRSGLRNTVTRPSMRNRPMVNVRVENRQTQALKRTRTSDERRSKISAINEEDEVSDHERNRSRKTVNFSVVKDDDISNGKRIKRESDNLRAIFQQEMINADDNNFKDCQCRVVRKLNDSPEQLRRLKRNAQQDEMIVENLEAAYNVEAPKVDTTDVVEVEYSPVEESTNVNDEVSTEGDFNQTTDVNTEGNNETKKREALETGEEEFSFNNFRNPEYKREHGEKSEESLHIQSENSSDSPRNRRLLTSEVFPVTALDLLEQETSTQDMIFENEERQFFQDKKFAAEEKTATINNIEDPASISTDTSETFTPDALESDTQGGIEITTGRIEDVGDISTGLREDKITSGQGTRYDHTFASGTTKREIEGEKTTSEKMMDVKTKVESVGDEIDDLEGDAPNKKLTSRMISTSRGKSRSNERAEEHTKAREARLMARVKALLALRKENESKKGRRVMEIPSRSSSNGNHRDQESRRKRAEEIERLMEKLREKRKMMLQRYQQEVLDIVDKVNDEEKRNLRRREIWENLKNSDDFRDMVDREKLAYILTYKPVDYSLVKREDHEEEEPANKKYVSTVEITRPLNIRERMVYPRNYRSYNDPRLIEYSKPYILTDQMTRLKDIDESEENIDKKVRYTDNPRRHKNIYYAVIEDLKNPRIIPYEEKILHNEQKGNIEALIPTYISRNDYTFESPERKHYIVENNYESTEEEDEENEQNRLSSERKIYVIDPSTYRGGEPTLQLHEESLKLTKNKKMVPKNLYQLLWNSNSDGSRKFKEVDANSHSEESYDELKRYDDKPFFQIWMKSINRSDGNKIIKEAAKKNDILGSKEQELLDSVADLLMEKSENVNMLASTDNASMEKLEQNVELAEQILKKDKSLGKKKDPRKTGGGTQDVTEHPKIYRSRSAEQEIKSENSNINTPVTQNSINNKDDIEVESKKSEVMNVRNRRSTENQMKDANVKELTPSLSGEESHKNERSKRGYYICVNFNSDESPNKDSSVILNVAKEYIPVAVPVQDSQNSRSALSEKTRSNLFDTYGNGGYGYPNYNSADFTQISSADYTNIRTSQEYFDTAGDYRPPYDRPLYDRPLYDRPSYYRPHHHEVSDHYQETLQTGVDINSGILPFEIKGDLGIQFDEDRRTDFFRKRAADTKTETRNPDLNSNLENGDTQKVYAKETSGRNNENTNVGDDVKNNEQSVLKLMPSTDNKFTRLRREVEKEERINHNFEKVQVSGTHETEGYSSSPGFIVTNKISEFVEPTVTVKSTEKKYPNKKYPRKKYDKKRKIDMLKKDLETDENEGYGLPSLIEGTIPKLQNVIVDGFKKAKNLTDSVERLIENIDENFNDAPKIDVQVDRQNATTNNQANTSGNETTNDVFHTTINNIKKFFVLLKGIAHILRG